MSVDEFVGWQLYLREQWRQQEKWEYYAAKICACLSGGTVADAIINFALTPEEAAQQQEKEVLAAQALLIPQMPEHNIVSAGVEILEE